MNARTNGTVYDLNFISTVERWRELLQTFTVEKQKKETWKFKNGRDDVKIIHRI